MTILTLMFGMLCELARSAEIGVNQGVDFGRYFPENVELLTN